MEDNLILLAPASPELGTAQPPLVYFVVKQNGFKNSMFIWTIEQKSTDAFNGW